MRHQSIKENLIRYYDAVQADLFIDEYIKSVSDYINFVTTINYLNKRLIKLERCSNISLNKFLAKKRILNKELDRFIENLRKTIKDSDIEDTTIENIFVNEIDLMQSGRMSSSQSREEKLLWDVHDIFYRIKEIGKENKVCSLGKIERGNWNLSINSFIDEYKQEKGRHDEEREKEVWGYWDYLSIIPKTLSFVNTHDFKGYGVGLDSEDDKVRQFYVSLFHAVRTKDKDRFNRQVEIKNLIKVKLDRVHIFLLKEIDEAVDSKFWTVTGIKNILDSDVSSFLSNIMSAVAGAIITYLIMKYIYGV